MKLKGDKFYILSFLLYLFLGTNLVTAKDFPFKSSPINPAFEKFIKEIKEGKVPKRLTGKHPLGLIPNPIKLRPHKPEKELKALTLPNRYDLRDEGLLTPIKDQNPYRTCWAFATYGSLESDLLKLSQPAYDFSENNLVNKHGFDPGFNDGGNISMSSAYLARGDGPVLESCDQYPNPGGSPNCPRVKYIEDIVWLPGRANTNDNQYLKQAVYYHGAVYTSMYWDGDFYNKSTYTYYYNGTENANHAVVIVGWDDNKETQASNPGAWIVRNSWGEGFGEGGYFYVSYYDTAFAFNTNAYFIDKPDLNNGNFTIHQYDELGLENALGCGNTIYGANVFRANKFQKIEAVSFFAYEPADYEIRVYKNCNNPNNISGSPAITQTGSISEPGYYTIDLNTPVYVEKDSYFLVIVKFTTTSSDAYPLGIEEKINNYSSGATCNSGESFVSCDGVTWDDICGYYDLTNVCIKALATSTFTPTTDITPIIMLLLGE
ncbi:papain family cysteine protease [Candidatus Desulfofervidus auxilii]|uniref:Papain family cysteine protease n=1 Tax=Desulfofervidus auxilii TaxID=1621989 RepID=A0A7U4QJP3_DESA2|nr:lectin like domain-containing protein [Candidatus Desulfofervidus auxilii]AMM40571.1 papain family cysteine protease [Candidatus Desulfofervidus auxilii]